MSLRDPYNIYQYRRYYKEVHYVQKKLPYLFQIGIFVVKVTKSRIFG